MRNGLHSDQNSKQDIYIYTTYGARERACVWHQTWDIKAIFWGIFLQNG